MTRLPSTFILVFAFAGSTILFLLAAPLAASLLSTTPADLWRVLADREVLRSLGVTFLAGLMAVIVGLAGGVPLAYLLARYSFWGRRVVLALVNLPVVIPHTAAGIALLIVFGRRGFLGSWMGNLGIAFTDSFWGIVVAMFFVSVPFLVNAAREAFALIDIEMELAALCDGASRWQAFWRISFPLAWQGLLGGAVMMWARGISEFGAVAILAYHPKIVPVLIYERFTGFGLSAAQPVAALLIILALLVFSVLNVWLLPRRSKD